jgi:hypothetical protein
MEKHWSRHAGAALTVLITLFLALDAGMKITGAEPALAATGELGFSAAATKMLGLVLGVATIIYAVPITRILGAILLTGYLGGAVAVQAVHGSPLATHVLFGVYVGIALWASIWLRNVSLRQLIPTLRSNAQ